LAPLFGGAALGLIMQRGVRRIGRVSGAEALGGALGCTLIPLAMWAGAPRSTVATGLLFGVAALALAHAGRRAQPRMALLWTLPLAVTAMVAGDFGEPYLELRSDHAGRRSPVGRSHWTEQGLITIDRPARGRRPMRIDRFPATELAIATPGNGKPRFEAADLPYLSSTGEPGPVLVIGSLGGREVGVARAYGHPRVDAVELNGRIFHDVLLDFYFRVSGYLFADPDKVVGHVGDGRALLASLPSDYQHVVVLDVGRFAQAAPRLLSRHDRMFTVDALRGYLARLRDDGSLLIRAQASGSPSVMAAAVEALGGPSEEARDKLLLCVGDKGWGVLLVHRQAPDANALHSLKKRCKKSRLDVDFPLENPRSRSADRDRILAANAAKMVSFDHARAASDDQPFVVPAPPFAQLQPLALQAIMGLRIGPPERPSDAPPRRAPAIGEESDDDAGADGPANRPHAVGIASAGAALVVLLGLLCVAVPPARTREASRAVALPPTLRWGFPLFGAALALCMFSLSDLLLQVSGDGAFGWALIIPLGLTGVGAGRLWVDSLSRARLRSATLLALAAGLGWIALMHFGRGSAAWLTMAPLSLKLAVMAALLLLSGGLLGVPFAAGVRMVGDWDRAPVSWCWGAHAAGWAVGSALAALLVHYVGVAKLWPLGLACFAVGAVLLALGAKSEAPPRWFVRRLR
jgi:hypothetical protein